MSAQLTFQTRSTSASSRIYVAGVLIAGTRLNFMSRTSPICNSESYYSVLFLEEKCLAIRSCRTAPYTISLRLQCVLCYSAALPRPLEESWPSELSKCNLGACRSTWPRIVRPNQENGSPSVTRVDKRTRRQTICLYKKLHRRERRLSEPSLAQWPEQSVRSLFPVSTSETETRD